VLLELAAARDAPNLDNLVAPDAVDLLVQVRGRADVVGNDAEAVAEGEFALRAANIDVAVLLVHLDEDGAPAGPTHSPRVSSPKTAW